MRALCLIREAVHYRRDAFLVGLRAAGFRIVDSLGDPQPADVLVIWNRYGASALQADRFEANGARVLVAENGYLGNDFAGDRWYSVSHSQHNGAGTWPQGGPERWDSLGVALAPWCSDTGDLLVLPQRGIGPAGVAMPRRWEAEISTRLGKRAHRIRPHPGAGPCRPLTQDLQRARAVVTWGSGAALKALAAGVPVFHDLPNWIGAGAARPVADLVAGDPPRRDDEARLAMFRRLAWAMWRLNELRSGEAFRRLLCGC